MHFRRSYHNFITSTPLPQSFMLCASLLPSNSVFPAISQPVALRFYRCHHMRRAHPSGLTQFNPTHSMTEQFEWKQRLEREQQAKHKHVERLNAICNHGKELLASNCVA